jgi:hypothetical protein
VRFVHSVSVYIYILLWDSIIQWLKCAIYSAGTLKSWRTRKRKPASSRVHDNCSLTLEHISQEICVFYMQFIFFLCAFKPLIIHSNNTDEDFDEKFRLKCQYAFNNF